jgi:large subunit ribosomal protein L24
MSHRVKAKIKKGDEVIIIAGKDKDRKGAVLKVIYGKNTNRVKLLVEGINMIKKHVRPNPQLNQKGGIIEKEAPIDISNVMLFNSAANKGDRVGYRILEDGRKVRYFKSTGDVVDID